MTKKDTERKQRYCLACGRPLTGRQRKWCSNDDCEGYYALYPEKKPEYIEEQQRLQRIKWAQENVDDLKRDVKKYTDKYPDNKDKRTKAINERLISDAEIDLGIKTNIRYEMSLGFLSRNHGFLWSAWSPSDLFPYSFRVWRDAERVALGYWNGSTLSISVYELLPATHTYTVKVLDAAGNSATDSVQVTVLASAEPIIDHPADIEYVAGSTGNSITWTPEDLFPHAYQILRNDTEVDSGSWDGSVITVSVDGLEIGTYNYSLTVSDEAGNLVTDTVFVYVRLHILGPATFSPLEFAFWLAVLAIEVAAAFFVVSRYRRIRGVKQSEPSSNNSDVLVHPFSRSPHDPRRGRVCRNTPQASHPSTDYP